MYRIIILIGLALALSLALPGSGSATGEGPEMRLVVVEPANACVGDECEIGTGESFTLGVDIVGGPDEGYVLAQTSIFYGSDVTYDFSSFLFAAPLPGEIVWPDCVSASQNTQIDRRLPIVPDENNTTELVSLGCITGQQPPLPVSEYAGRFLELSMTCSSQESSSVIELLPYTDIQDKTPETIVATTGSLFVTSDNVKVFPKVNTLTLDCVDVAPAAVGGIALDAEVRALPVETAEPDGYTWGIAIAGTTAASLFAVGGAAWYARRRWLT